MLVGFRWTLAGAGVGAVALEGRLEVFREPALAVVEGEEVEEEVEAVEGEEQRPVGHSI